METWLKNDPHVADSQTSLIGPLHDIFPDFTLSINRLTVWRRWVTTLGNVHDKIVTGVRYRYFDKMTTLMTTAHVFCVAT